MMLEDVMGNIPRYSNRQFSRESDCEFLLFIILIPH